MHRAFSKLAIVGAAFVVLIGITVLIPGQPASKLKVQPASKHLVGVPDDWSHHHLVFSDIGTYEQAIAKGTYSKWINLYYDPRYIIQQMKRNRAAAGAPEMTAALETLGFGKGRKPWPPPPPRRGPSLSPLKTDWSQYMNSASAEVGADNYPAKYSWYTNSPTTAGCAGGAAPDYVAYNTGVAGSSTQASIIAYDNLYATTCAGTVPQTYWAYDTGGTIETSVALSELGDQVAFIHSASTASLVLLKWSATGGAFTGTTSAGSASVTSISISCGLLLAGEPIYGPTIPSGDKVSSCTGTTLTLTTGTGVTAGSTQPLTYNNQFQAATTGGSTSITVPSGTCTPATANSPIYGTGIPQGDTIATCSGTALTLTTAASASEPTETITFSPATAAAPVVLTANSNANYRACAAPCMTTISFGNGNNDTISSPFVDYVDDIIYVGDSGGYLHKFTDVFGTVHPTTAPAQASSGWPAQAGNSNPLTSAVYDYGSQRVYVCNFNSNLTEVTTGGSTTSSASISGAHNDIQEGPIVDSSAAKVYVFVEGGSNNYIDQFATSFSSSANPLATVNVGTGGSDSQLLFSGAFDNAYYTSGTSPNGNLYVCGNTNGSTGPILYQIPITSGAMGTTAVQGPTLTSASTQCSPLNEVYNTGATGGPYDWIYLGVNASGSPSGCGGGGCVMGVTVTSWLASTSYSLGQMVANNHFNIEVVTTAGTSGTSQPTWPAAGTVGTVTSDGTGTLKWTSEGPFLFTAFATSHPYTANTVIVDSSNNLERVTIAGTSGSSAPSWNATFGGMTTSGTVTFTNQGPSGIVGSPYDGGTSGIVIDNMSTAAGASNIYFSTLGTGTTNSCATNPGTHGGCAIQASQSAP
ncbi:MAG: hypothetical protein WCD04_13420 [Terriglobia bacterium]|jgi:hypothetical protein